MKRIVFDIEADALLPTISKIHCLVIQDADTGEVKSYIGHKDIQTKGLGILENAEEVAGHNILTYDLPALKKVLGWTLPSHVKAFDTLLVCKLYNPDIYSWDVTGRYKALEKKNYGSHSLEAWGQRLGNHKMSKPTDFSVFTEEMLTYCIQDVGSNLTVYKHLKKLDISAKALEVEHTFQMNMMDLESAGFPFDVDFATKLYAKLSSEREVIRKELTTLFPTRVIERVSEKTGKPLKAKIIEFNPSSRDHIAYWFREKYKWQPKDFTPAGKPEVNAEILESLDYPEAKELKRYFELDKVIGMVAEGANAWLKLIGEDRRIHGRINTIGAASTRCTHSAPNLAQVPSPRKPFGYECRQMFHAPKGYKQVGVDLNAIELRCFAHYLAAYDDGDYANAIESGDIHWKNAIAAGFYPNDGKPYDEKVPEMKQARNNAKTFIFV